MEWVRKNLSTLNGLILVSFRRDFFLNSILKPFFSKIRSSLPDFLLIPLWLFKSVECFIEGFWSLFREKYTGFSINDWFSGTSFSVGNYGCSMHHGFDWDESEVFFRWKEKSPSFTVELILHIGVWSKNPLDVSSGFSPEFMVEEIVRVGGKYEFFPILIECLHEEIEFFIGNTATHPEIIVFSWGIQKRNALNSWIYNFRISMIIFLYPFCGGFWICKKNINSLSCLIIHSLHPWFYEAKYLFHKWIHPSKFHHLLIFLCMTPIIPNRCMTIDNDGSIWFFSPFSESHIFRFRRTRADDDVIFWEIEIPKCIGTQYSGKFMFSIEKWYFLYPAGEYFAFLEHWMLHITDACVDVCFWKELEKVWYDELCTTEIDEPVTHDSDFFFILTAVHEEWKALFIGV